MVITSVLGTLEGTVERHGHRGNQDRMVLGSGRVRS
jgi:hypothetical protein